MTMRHLIPETRTAWFGLDATLIAWSVILAMIAYTCSPVFVRMDTFGIHDWDFVEAHRYLPMKSLLEYGQFPFWNPYSCGGHTNWGNLDGGTNLVSPLLPLYLFTPLATAVRLEIVVMAILSALGTWLLAGRFAESRAARLFVCVVWVVNGRWALQISVGHAMHLSYGYLPWVLFFFDRACGVGPKPSPHPLRNSVLAGACISLIVYAGGIYPLPQTALILGTYAVLLAVTARDPKPLVAVAVAAAVALGLSAPKLLPLLDMMSRYPRYVDSSEYIDPFAFVQILTARGQDIDSHPAPVPVWAWQEYGMYIGWAAFLLLIVGVLVTRGPRESPLKWVGLGIVVVGVGNFHEFSPWGILHTMPIFRSQHVPSRWFYTAPLLLACASAPLVDRVLGWRPRAHWPLESILIVGVAFIAFDIAKESRLPLSRAFVLELPSGARSPSKDFHQETNVPADLSYSVRDYSAPSLPAMMAGIGTIDCGTFQGLNRHMRVGDRGPGLGARGRADPKYRGEAYTVSGEGQASVVEFSPNAVTIQVEDATPGDLVVMNQNYDPGWRVDGDKVTNWEDAIAAEIRSPRQRFSFRYVPRAFASGLFLLGLTLASLFGVYSWRRKTRA